jgi:hypothetical protein
MRILHRTVAIGTPSVMLLAVTFEGLQKTRWSNFPSGIFKREGLRIADITPVQRDAVMKLLAAALSTDGYRKVTEIMRGDEILKQTGGGGGGVRGRGGPAGGGVVFGMDEDYLAFVGTPSTTTAWMLQFGGHQFEGREIRPLGRENDKAFALINANLPQTSFAWSAARRRGSVS